MMLGNVSRRVLLVGLLGLSVACGGGEGSSVPAPTVTGLNQIVIESQELLPTDAGCRLKVTFRNVSGNPISGQLVYNVLSPAGTKIGVTVVFPSASPGSTRTATSDKIPEITTTTTATGTTTNLPTGRLLPCSEIGRVQLDPTLSVV
jgi:hypothetical protein